jgi:E3 ubiquitin-protein ligase TRIP12
MKPLVNTQEPQVMQMDHVRTNLKREQMLEERYSEIDRENRILLEKMSGIMKEKSQTVPSGMSARARSQESRGPVSLNRDFRKKELIRITKENQQILKRIQQAQPIYNHVQWEGEHKRNVGYLKNCSDYPLVLKTKRTPPSSELVRMGEEKSEDPLGDLPPHDALVTQQSAGEEEDDMKYVLKEGQQIGEKYYLLEMSTDGRTLVITAYDGDSQQTLELVVKEKNHRKLYRESGGDYAAIAKKLRVEGDRLVFESESQDTLPPLSPAVSKSSRSPKNITSPKKSPSPNWEPTTASRSLDPMAATASSMDLDEMVVRHEKGSNSRLEDVNVELGFTNDLEARVRLRGLTPVTPTSLGSTWQG